MDNTIDVNSFYVVTVVAKDVLKNKMIKASDRKCLKSAINDMTRLCAWLIQYKGEVLVFNRQKKGKKRVKKVV